MNEPDHTVEEKTDSGSNAGKGIKTDTSKTDVNEKDINFHKLFLRKFIHTLEPIVGKETGLYLWILANTDNSNVLGYTYRQIAKENALSYRMVAETMRRLLDVDFLRKRTAGGYMVNPDIIFKGRYSKRCFAIKKYEDCVKEDTEKIRLRNIQDNIARLKKQEEYLKTCIDIKDGHKRGEADNGK